MNATSQIILTVEGEMPEKIWQSKKHGFVPNRWAHKVRLYNPRDQVHADRLTATIPGAGVTTHTYFTKAQPGEVGFLDYYLETVTGLIGDGSPKRVLHIGYMTVRDDYRKNGIAWQMAHYIVQYTAPDIIEWGDLWHIGAEHIADKATALFPNIKQYAKRNPRF